MLAIKDPSLVPPGGAFRFVCDDEPCKSAATAVEFRHHTVPGVFEAARKHAEANGHEFTNAKFTANVCRNAHPIVCHEVEDSTGLPPIVERVVDAAKAVVRHARHGFKNTEDELQETRHAICRGCVYYGGESGGTWFGIACRKCGCTGVKLRWSQEKCPLGLW